MLAAALVALARAERSSEQQQKSVTIVPVDMKDSKSATATPTATPEPTASNPIPAPPSTATTSKPVPPPSAEPPIRDAHDTRLRRRGAFTPDPPAVVEEPIPFTPPEPDVPEPRLPAVRSTQRCGGNAAERALAATCRYRWPPSRHDRRAAESAGDQPAACAETPDAAGDPRTTARRSGPDSLTRTRRGHAEVMDRIADHRCRVAAIRRRACVDRSRRPLPNVPGLDCRRSVVASDGGALLLGRACLRRRCLQKPDCPRSRRRSPHGQR